MNLRDTTLEESGIVVAGGLLKEGRGAFRRPGRLKPPLPTLYTLFTYWERVRVRVKEKERQY